MGLLSVNDAAKKAGLSEQRIRQLIDSGVVKATRLGKRSWAVDEQSLRRYTSKPRKPGPKPRK